MKTLRLGDLKSLAQSLVGSECGRRKRKLVCLHTITMAFPTVLSAQDFLQFYVAAAYLRRIKTRFRGQGLLLSPLSVPFCPSGPEGYGLKPTDLSRPLVFWKDHGVSRAIAGKAVAG